VVPGVVDVDSIKFTSGYLIKFAGGLWLSNQDYRGVDFSELLATKRSDSISMFRTIALYKDCQYRNMQGVVMVEKIRAWAWFCVEQPVHYL